MTSFLCPLAARDGGPHWNDSIAYVDPEATKFLRSGTACLSCCCLEVLPEFLSEFLSVVSRSNKNVFATIVTSVPLHLLFCH